MKIITVFGTKSILEKLLFVYDKWICQNMFTRVNCVYVTRVSENAGHLDYVTYLYYPSRSYHSYSTSSQCCLLHESDVRIRKLIMELLYIHPEYSLKELGVRRVLKWRLNEWPFVFVCSVHSASECVNSVERRRNERPAQNICFVCIAHCDNAIHCHSHYHQCDHSTLKGDWIDYLLM